MGKATNLINQVFQNLTVINKTIERTQNGSIIYECKCICGNIIKVPAYCLNNGNTKSCGCYKIAKATTHNKSRDPLYILYHNMIARCYEPNNKSYSAYGLRGIIVCDRWLDPINGFQNFLNDIPSKPGNNYTFERKDSNGNYELSNITWATWTEQQRNRTNNVIHSIEEAEDIRTQYANGKRICDLAKEIKCSETNIRRIIRKETWY